MKTLVVLIGNSDDKLSQREWHCFTRDISDLIDSCAGERHFVGYSLPVVPWQNAAYCFEVERGPNEEALGKGLRRLAAQYRQDSIAVVCGETKFIKPE